jgi:hypothetical protein
MRRILRYLLGTYWAISIAFALWMFTEKPVSAQCWPPSGSTSGCECGACVGLCDCLESSSLYYNYSCCYYMCGSTYYLAKDGGEGNCNYICCTASFTICVFGPCWRDD